MKMVDLIDISQTRFENVSNRNTTLLDKPTRTILRRIELFIYIAMRPHNPSIEMKIPADAFDVFCDLAKHGIIVLLLLFNTALFCLLNDQ